MSRKVIDRGEYAYCLYGLMDDEHYTINNCFNLHGSSLGVSIRTFYEIVNEGIKKGLFSSFNLGIITIIKKEANK